MIPDIAIPSYMGGQYPEKRFENHLRQRTLLARQFPEKRVVSYCSCYSRKQIKEMKRKGFTAYHWAERRRKWQTHNYVLKQLYAIDYGYRSMLILDDDVIPRLEKDGDVVSGLVNTAGLIKFWLDDPLQMIYPCVFFSASGLRFDAFYRAKKAVFENALFVVLGWAMMVRSDLGVLWDKQMVRRLVTERKDRPGLDDIAFRVKCAAEGKPVGKHNRAFFKTFQSKDKGSTYADDVEVRKEYNREGEAVLRELFPEVMKELRPGNRQRWKAKEDKRGLFKR
jgi:hypothetical protein